MKTTKKTLAALVAGLFVAAAAASAQAESVESMIPQVKTLAAQEYPQFVGLYQDIHRHPEIAFQEVRTAAKLAGEMRKLGFQVTEHVGKTGIVAIYKNGPGPLVLVRTELDALPMQEKTGLPYASQAKTQSNGRETYVAHSCGHDVHMAAWVATAKALLAMKSHWKGTLMFIGQPAEETLDGADAMLKDGLFERFGTPDYAFALHTTPAAYGTIEYGDGPRLSAADGLEITFHGRGAHGSAPFASIDPIVEAAHFITDVQSVVAREKYPSAFGVVTVGAVQAGTVGNIIPDSATLRGTVRTYDEATEKKLLDGIRRTANAAAMMAGAPAPDVKLTPQVRSVINQKELTTRTEQVWKAAFGDKALRTEPATASEDFSEFGRKGTPLLDFQIGVYSPEYLADMKKAGKPIPGNHSPFFAPVFEPAFKTGVEAMTLAVLNVMQPK